jgi:hypothetical protein
MGVVSVRIPLIVALWCAAADGAVVVTSGGVRHEGGASFAAGGIVVKDAKGATTTVPLAELSAAAFDPPAAAPAAPLNDRPAEWSKSDVGTCFAGGRVEAAAGGRVTVLDFARGIRFGRADQDHFFFAHQGVRGDAAIVARLRVMDDNRSARAGLMIRASTRPDAPFAMLARGGIDGRTAIVRRAAAGDACDEACKSERAVLGATWLKLERRGNAIAGFESVDGKAWTPLGEVDVPMDETVLVGLASATATAAGGRSVFDNVGVAAAAAGGPAARVPRGIVTRGGSFLACDVTAADETGVEFAGPDGTKQSLPPAAVARCVFAPLLTAQAERLRGAAGAGVLLINGDFLEGHVDGVGRGRVRVTSVLFGTKSFDTQREVAAVTLRATMTRPCAFEVRLANRSVLRATSVEVAKDGEMVLDDADLGRQTIRTADVVEIKRPG